MTGRAMLIIQCKHRTGRRKTVKGGIYQGSLLSTFFGGSHETLLAYFDFKCPDGMGGEGVWREMCECDHGTTTSTI
jgi:hypothetical protein